MKEVDHNKHHESHHAFIVERIAAFRSTSPRATGVARARRRALHQKAAVTLIGHLRCCHGYREVTGLPLSIDEYEAIHTRYHEEGNE